jgi:hypothetical protein
MAKPKKVKVIRKLSSSQLQLTNSYSGISGIQTIGGAVGIASTTIATTTCFILTGKRNLSDRIDGSVAVQAQGSVSGHDGGAFPTNWGEGSCPGGHGAAGGGGNFIYSDISDFANQSWCVRNVSSSSTSTVFSQATDSSSFLIATKGYSGNPGNPGRWANCPGENPPGQPGNPGTVGLSSNIACTYGSTNLYYNVSCTGGCPGSGCPNSFTCGGRSGYCLSSYYNNIVSSSDCNVTCGLGGSKCCSESPGSDCGRGWVHINTTGRPENSL